MALQMGRQNVVWQLEADGGRRVVRGVLLALFAVSMATLYGSMNFQGLKDARPMEMAQSARVWAETGVFGTQCLRPAALSAEKEPAAVILKGHLEDVSDETGAGTAWVDDGGPETIHHDLMHPPLWPAALAAWFKVAGTPVPTSQNETWTFSGDWVPVVLNYLFVLLGAAMAGCVARRLFDERVATLTQVSFLLSNVVWRRATDGGEWSLAVFLGVAALAAGVRAAEPMESEREEWSRWTWAAAAALATAGAFLTRYACGFVAAGLFFLLGTARQPRSWLRACSYLAVTAAAVAPWVARNLAACGSPFGLLGYEMLDGTILYRDGILMRTPAPELASAASLVTAVQLKMIANLREFAQGLPGWGGCGALLALFGAMYWHRLNRPVSKALRWCLLPAVAALAIGASMFSADSMNALLVLWPVAAAYGWAFLLLLLDRLQLESRIPAAMAVAAVTGLTALPTLLQVIPPKTGLTYPPYFHRYAGWVGSLMEDGEWLATDMPWATAWYAGRTSVLLPDSVDSFYEFHEKTHPFAMAYFTLLTFNRPWMRDLAAPNAPEGDWYQILRDGRVPKDFPLPYGHFIVGGDQFLLADRQRW